MKVLFLDIDGVLTSHAYWRSTGRQISLHDLDRKAVTRLNSVLDRTGAMVVVTSTWRLHFNRVELQERLDRYGFTGTVLSATGTGKDRKEKRGLEIQAWLDNPRYANKDSRHYVERFAIVDDDTDMAHLLPILVQTHMHGDDGGLQDEHVEKLVARLGEKI